jgi:hypothetical protein
MSNAANDLRNSVVRRLLSEAGESPSLGTNNRPSNNTSVGSFIGGNVSGGIAGMQGDPSPKALAAILNDKRYQAIMPLWIDMLKKEMGL